MTEPAPTTALLAPHLIDNSVYARAGHPSVASVWGDAIRRELLVSCGAFLLEAVITARDATEAAQALEELRDGLPYVEITQQTWALAYAAQQKMAAVAPSFHRRPPADYLIAAAAHQYGIGVLHYDHDYSAIAQCSGLRFQATWIATAGTLETAAEQPQIVRQLKRAITSRLAQFSGDPEEEALHRRIVAILDAELLMAGKAPLPAPPGAH